MVAADRNSILCIELGTSKISALRGTVDKGGNPVVVNFASEPSEGAVCKGEIVNAPAVSSILDKVLARLDMRGGRGAEKGRIYCSVSGPSIRSRQGEGNVMIYEGDRQVTRNHIIEAVEKAESIALPPDQIALNTFDSYFMLDSRYRTANPIGHSATRLDAFIHSISADRNRIDTVRSLIRDLGFDTSVSCVFSGVGSLYAVLREDEKNKGTLLIDIGSGLTEYVLVKQDGILLSGVIPVGMDNLANDLAIGLELGMEQCRKLIQENRLAQMASSGGSFMEFPGGGHNAKRRIPVGSFEKIIDARLVELFSILREKVGENDLFRQIESGIVVTGGGSLFAPVPDTLRRVMGLHVRCGEAADVSGVMNDLAPSCRYASLLGLLKLASEDLEQEGSGKFGQMGDMLEGAGGKIMGKIKDIMGAFKI
ncbi:MAG: cell division protein FtsA [Lentisphaeria bacterium]|nr:cell division protein FtsA [Lentisphaeria bacterium]